MITKIAAVLSVGILLFLGGCLQMGKPEPILTVAVTPDAGHPPFEISVVAVCSEGDGAYLLNLPNETLESETGKFTAMVDTWPFPLSVTWIGEAGTKTEELKLKLINERPVAHYLSFSRADYRSKTIIDLRFRASGCAGGAPETLLGIEDPDYTAGGFSTENDNFLYRVEVYDKDTGIQETVYDESGQPLARGEYTATAIFYWFPGWVQISPPFPFKSCAPIPPEVTPESGEGTPKEIHVYVKEFGSEYHWLYEVKMAGGPCA